MCLLALLVLAGQGEAITFTVQGVKHSSLSALIDFSFDPTAGSLAIDVTNTSDADTWNAAYLTGFAFNVPDGVTLMSGPVMPGGWNAAFSPNGIGSPMGYGNFDAAALSGRNLQGGGQPFKGIPIGETYRYIFGFDVPEAGGLNEQDFLGLLSQPRGEGGCGEHGDSGCSGDHGDSGCPGGHEGSEGGDTHCEAGGSGGNCGQGGHGGSGGSGGNCGQGGSGCFEDHINLASFLARFRGLDPLDAGLTADCSDVAVPTAPVPLPPTLWLWGAGLLTLAGMRARPFIRSPRD